MKIIYCIILLVIGRYCFAQKATETTKLSLLDQSNFWSVVIDTTSVPVPNFNPYRHVESVWYKLGKDTVINGLTVKTLLKKEWPIYYGWPEVGYLRQDSSKIYFGNDEREILLYDFGLKVGEKMESALNIDFEYVSRLDSIRDTTLNNSVRKIYYLTEYPDYDPTKTQKEIWVEGIGSLTDGLLRQTMLGSSLDPVLLPNYQLMTFYQNNKLVYQMKRYKVQVNFSIGDIQPLLSADKLWSTMQGPMFECPHSLYCASYYTKLEEDTVIDGIHYMKVLTTNDEKMQVWTTWGTIWENQDHQVLYRERRTNREGLMYDFDCKPGEILHLESSCTGDYVVDSIATKIDIGIARKHIYISDINYWKSSEEWIEGIGTNWGILNAGGDGHCMLSSYSNELLCFYEGNEKLFQSSIFPNYCYLSPEIINGVNSKTNSSQFKVFPNPVSGELFLQTNQTIYETYTLELYSIKGELLKTECLDEGSNLYRIDTSSLRNGIYILRLISDSGKYAEETIIKE